MSNGVFNEFPPISLMSRTLILQILLMAPSNMPPQHIKTVHSHTGFLPKAGADLYFDWETVDHRLALSPNSKRVSRIIIPNHLIIFLLVVPFSSCLTNFWEVYSVINLSWLGGKRRVNYSRQEKVFPSSHPRVSLLPVVILRNHWWNGWGPLIFV